MKQASTTCWILPPRRRNCSSPGFGHWRAAGNCRGVRRLVGRRFQFHQPVPPELLALAISRCARQRRARCTGSGHAGSVRCRDDAPRPMPLLPGW